MEGRGAETLLGGWGQLDLLECEPVGVGWSRCPFLPLYYFLLHYFVHHFLALGVVLQQVRVSVELLRLGINTLLNLLQTLPTLLNRNQPLSHQSDRDPLPILQKRPKDIFEFDWSRKLLNLN